MFTNSKMLYEKKGQAGSVNSIVVLVIGVMVAITALIFIGALGGSIYSLQETSIDSIGNNVVVNKSVILYNNTPYDLGVIDIHSGLVVTKPGLVVQLNNFSIDYAHGIITLIRNNSGANIFNASNINLSYTYGASEIGSSIKTSIIGGFGALEQAGSFTPIIVLAAVIVIVLGVMLGIAGGNNRSGGTAL